MKITLPIILALFCTSALAEDTSYGSVNLEGLARNSWDLNPLGPHNAMVCNMNGPDGFLAIRSDPNRNAAIKRKLKRLAIIVVDTRVRNGHWVKVSTAYRTYTINGKAQNPKELHVTGWAHDGYLCSFID